MCLKNYKEKCKKNNDFEDTDNFIIKKFYYSDPFENSNENTFLIYTHPNRETML